MKTTYILGASGLIGGALLNKLQLHGNQVIGTYSKNMEKSLIHFDFLNPDFEVLKSVKSEDTIFLMTAYSNPNWISENRSAAAKLNLVATKKIINFLSFKMPRIVFMSSVEIFDGTKGCYGENDIANPLNFYGEMKLEIENYLVSQYRNHCIVRTGWNVGLNEKSRCVVQLTYETLLKPNAKMASDNFFSLALVDDTAEILFRLLDKPQVKKIHICSDKVICRTELAKAIIMKSKLANNMSFKDCLFEEIVYKEPRGRINDLDNSFSKKFEI